MKHIDFAAVKDAISIVAFFENFMQAKLVMVSGGARRYGLCPQCGYREQSHRVSVVTKGFNCFGCNAKGDVIDAAEMFWGVDKLEAATRLMESMLSPTLAYLNTEYRDAPHIPDERDDTALSDLVQKMLTGSKPDDAIVMGYLKSRGISERTYLEGVARGLIVAMPGVPAYAGNWLNKYVGTDTLKRTKVLKEGRKTPAVIYKPLCFIGDNKASVEFRVAAPITKEGDIKSIRYGAGCPWTWKGTKGVMVTEGVIDMLSAVELGTQRTVVAIPGCQSWRLDWFDQYKGQQILLALDADGPGLAAAEQMQADMRAVGHDVHVYTLPSGCKDLNEQLVATKQ